MGRQPTAEVGYRCILCFGTRFVRFCPHCDSACYVGRGCEQCRTAARRDHTGTGPRTGS